MIAKHLRFHGYGSLRYLYKNADAARSHYFIVKAIANPHRKSSRLAVVVSKKVHKSAFGRNRIRRRLYEVLRQELPSITTAHDIAVIVTSAEVLSAEHKELVTVLHELLQRSRVIT
ncbi:ribonuclease P protein component [Candidatus Saccharibacteria bacterium]|nr:MAG: ribonuclease P protein component [Candidatus Saccharibacteria bacterium]